MQTRIAESLSVAATADFQLVDTFMIFLTAEFSLVRVDHRATRDHFLRSGAQLIGLRALTLSKRSPPRF